MKKFSSEHLLYLKKRKNNNILIWSMRFIILFVIMILWEFLAKFEYIDSFIFSCPSKIYKTLIELFKENNLLYHIGFTLFETIIGFLLAVVFGYVFALIVCSFDSFRRIIEPYLVVLNSLPKIALGPIIIVFFGSGNKSTIFMTYLVTVIVATITMINGFLATDNEKIKLLNTLRANKIQIITKVVIPGSLHTFISMLKVCVGLSWIGSIMGEYIASKAGIGYLIVYGGQVLKLDLVMTCTIILCLLASLMYVFVVIIEKLIIKH